MQSEAFVLIFPAWILLLFLCKKRREAGLFALASVISIVLTSLFNHLLLGHASIRDTGFGFDLSRVWRTFLEPETGVLLFLPWSLAAFCFLLLAFLHRNPNAPDQQMVLKMVAGGILPVAAVYMILPYTGQFCYGPRYWVPYVPWLALAFGIGVKQYWGIIPTLVRLLLMVLIYISVVFAIMAAILPPDDIWHHTSYYPLKLLLGL